MATGRIGTGSWVTRTRPAHVLPIPDPAPPRWSGQLIPPRSRTVPPRPENWVIVHNYTILQFFINAKLCFCCCLFSFFQNNFFKWFNVPWTLVIFTVCKKKSQISQLQEYHCIDKFKASVYNLLHSTEWHLAEVNSTKHVMYKAIEADL